MINKWGGSTKNGHSDAGHKEAVTIFYIAVSSILESVTLYTCSPYLFMYSDGGQRLCIVLRALSKANSGRCKRLRVCIPASYSHVAHTT